MRKILIILFLCFTNISFSNAANIGNIEIKIIGNENLDKEFIESIIDTNTNLEDEELVNYIIKELFSTGYFESVDCYCGNWSEDLGESLETCLDDFAWCGDGVCSSSVGEKSHPHRGPIFRE